MDTRSTGQAIAYLRKKRGLTQQQIGNLLGISDKAVSKWERGVCIPDVYFLEKLATILDSDVGSILSGSVGQDYSSWKGVLYLNQKTDFAIDMTGKPRVYLQLCYFALVNIRQVAIVATESLLLLAKETLEELAKYGFQFAYLRKDREVCEVGTFAGTANLMVIRSEWFIYGVNVTAKFRSAMIEQRSGITMLVVYDPKLSNQKISYDMNHSVMSSHSDEEAECLQGYAFLPILFLPNKYIHDCYDMSISSLARKKLLYVEALRRGTIAFPLNTPEAFVDVALFSRMMKEQCGIDVYSLEEILRCCL